MKSRGRAVFFQILALILILSFQNCKKSQFSATSYSRDNRAGNGPLGAGDTDSGGADTSGESGDTDTGGADTGSDTGGVDTGAADAGDENGGVDTGADTGGPAALTQPIVEIQAWFVMVESGANYYEYVVTLQNPSDYSEELFPAVTEASAPCPSSRRIEIKDADDIEPFNYYCETGSTPSEFRFSHNFYISALKIVVRDTEGERSSESARINTPPLQWRWE